MFEKRALFCIGIFQSALSPSSYFCSSLLCVCSVVALLIIYNVNFNNSGSFLGESDGLSSEDAAFGLPFPPSVRAMSVTGELFFSIIPIY